MQRRHAGLNFSTNEGLQSREEGNASAGLGEMSIPSSGSNKKRRFKSYTSTHISELGYMIHDISHDKQMALGHREKLSTLVFPGRSFLRPLKYVIISSWLQT